MLEQRGADADDLDTPALVANPIAAAREVARFLGEGLGCEAMAAVVDPDLYRRRPGPPV